jgi:hypothetical protein
MKKRWLIAIIAGLTALSAVLLGTRALDGAETDADGRPSKAADDKSGERRHVAGPTITLGRTLFAGGVGSASGAALEVVGTIGQAYVNGPTTTGPLPITQRVCAGWWCVELSDVIAVRDPELPKQVWFGRPRPNPSDGRLVLDLALPRAARVDVRVIDVLGRRVHSLAAGLFEPGEHTLTWDGRTETGSRVHPGVYFMLVQVDGDVVAKRRMVVTR